MYINKNCIVIFNKSWGEVDFILPMIKFLGEKNINVISIFRNKQVYCEKKNYKDLYKILIKNTEVLNSKNNFNYDKLKINHFFSLFKNYKYLVEKLKNFKFSRIRNYLKNIQNDNSEIFIRYIKNKYSKIDYILCADFDSDYQIWINNFKDSKFLLFPHAISIRGTEYDHLRNIPKNYISTNFKIRVENLKKFPKNTILFGSDDDEITYFRKFTGENIILKKIGFVRLSNGWMQYRKKLKKIKNNISPKKNLLLLIGKENYIGRTELDKKIKDICKIAEKIKYNIIIKNHPRNNLNINPYKMYGKIKIYESELSLHATLENVDFVIMTSKSGVCLDCIAYNKIPIEFYKSDRNNKKNNFYEFRINNKVISIYNFKGLTYNFDNYLKLDTFIKTITNNSFLKRKYYKNCKLSYNKVVDHNFKYFENFRVLFN